MSLVILCIYTLIAAELFLRLPFIQTFKALAGHSSKALEVVSSKTLSDEQKQAGLLRASGQIFWCSIKSAIMFGFLAGVILGLDYLLSQAGLAGENLLSDELLTWPALLITGVAALVYALIRRRLISQPDRQASQYQGGSKMLHQLALGFPALARASFDLESSAMAEKVNPEQVSQGRHVFIAGLARAGTTILMRTFYHSGDYRSLTYRDMPFVLMPGNWSKLSRFFRDHQAESERAHGDSIMVSFDSPEAFEEVFWRCFYGERYIQPDRLTPHAPGQEALESFKQYVALILASAEDEAQNKYLSKNNNNILRLEALSSAFPQANIIIPFRDPIQQAASLLNQHERFVEQQKQDPFVLKYMNWLGHHEFGLGHRPFDFSGGETAASAWPVDSINYWLALWIQCYKHVLRQRPTGSFLLSYEHLCAFPDVVLGLFVQRGELAETAAAQAQCRLAAARQPEGVDDELHEAAQALHEQLLILSRRQFQLTNS